MGVALEDLGRIDDAVQAYRQALQIKPDYAEVYYNLGTALAKAGKPEESLRNLDRAIELKPDYANAHSSSGDVFLGP